MITKEVEMGGFIAWNVQKYYSHYFTTA